MDIKTILREMVEEGSLLTEASIEDFFKFLAQDPSSHTMAHMQYVSSLDRGLAKKKTNPMKGRFYKMTHYKFQWGETYKNAVARNNPDWEIQARSGEYTDVEGFSVLEFDKAGDEVLPITNETVVKSQVVVLDEQGNVAEVISFNEMKAKYAQYFTNSFLNPKPYVGSGQTFKPLKIKRTIRLAAGGNTWDNPHFEFGHINFPSL